MDKKTLVFSAFVGFIIGILWKSDWQWSLEAAQVVAGVISLPSSNPMTIFAKHLYAPFLIWPQVGLLKLGLSSEFISILFSGIQSGFSFASVTALLLVLSKDRVVSLVVPIVLMYFPDGLFSAHSYAIFFPTNFNNGGILAFYSVILAIASLGAGNVAVFLCMIGILPALHPGIAMGIWFGTIGYYVVADKEQKLQFQKNIRWFMCGLAFFVVTVIIHELLSGSFFEQATVSEKQIVDYFVTFIDGHRSPRLLSISWSERLEYFEPEVLLLGTILLFLGRYKQLISKGSLVVLRFLAVSSLVGVVMTILWEIFSLSFPLILKSIMFARWLNFDSIILPLFLISVMRYKRPWRGIIAISMLFFFSAYGPILWWWLFIVLICCFEAEIRFPSFRWLPDNRLQEKLFRIITICFSLIILGTMAKGGLRPFMKYTAPQAALVSKISQGDGLFISSYQALTLPQAMTNRGLVFNLYWMDTMAYVPTMADEMEMILRDVYGFSIFDKGIWPSLDVIHTQWENRTLIEWQEIKLKYRATDVLSPKSWVLALPKVADSETLTLYHIP